MTNEEIKTKLNSALVALLRDEAYLIQYDVSERAITHKLAEHMQREFSEYKVDCEYNRNFNEPKSLKTRRETLTERLNRKYKDRLDKLEPDELLSISTYPDVIVHIRGSNEFNLLVVEVKKVDGEPDDLDRLKLKEFTKIENNSYNFQIGVSIIIKTNKNFSRTFEIEFPELRWFENGARVEQ